MLPMNACGSFADEERSDNGVCGRLVYIASLLVAVLLVPGCFVDAALKPGFYKPSALAGPKMRAHVVVVRNPANEEVIWREGIRGFTSLDVSMQPAYDQAVESAFASIFTQVEMVDEEEGLTDADFAVTMPSGFPEVIAFSITECKSRSVVATFNSDGVQPQFIDNLGATITFHILALPTLGLFWPMAALIHDVNKPRTLASLEQTISSALEHVTTSLRSDSTFLDRLPQHRVALSSEAAGDDHLQVGDMEAAFDAYAAAIAEAVPWSSLHQRLVEKVLRIVPLLSDAPPIPDEARRRMARGLALCAEAGSDPAGYARAAEEMMLAVGIAPWWGKAYLNVGIALEGAEMYAEAVVFLKRYLLANPNAEDRRTVQDKIYALELKAEDHASTVVGVAK